MRHASRFLALLFLAAVSWGAVAQTTITVKDGAGASQTVNTQPMVGAAGTPSTDVLTVQGSASGTPIPVNIDTGGTTHPTNVSQVGGSALALGANTKANAIPVTLASDQPAVPISAASLPLPAGAATSANQTTLITNTGGLPTSTGQKTAANSLGVVIASDQSAVPTSLPFFAVAGLSVGAPGSTNYNCSGYAASYLVVSALSGTIAVTTSDGDSNYYSATVLPLAGGPSVSTITATGAYLVNTSGAVLVKLTASNTFSGSYTMSAMPVGTAISNLPFGQQAAVNGMSVALANEQIQDLNITGQATQTASGNNIVLATAGTGSTDANGYRAVAIEIIPTGTVSSGVVTFEGSNDNTNFVAVPLYDEASLTANPVSTVSPATGVFRFFRGSLNWRYFRARISTVIGGGGSIAAATRFSQTTGAPSLFTVTQATAANLNATVTATNLSSNIAQVGGTNTVTGGVAGILAVGGNIASGTAATANPVPVGGTDVNGLTRRVFLSPVGETITSGSGESVTQFSIGTGAAAVTDGTNGKSVMLPPRECDLWMQIAAISTTPTMQLEGSWDGVLFSILPLSRTDNTAASQQYTAQAAFTPVAGAVYKGRSYGFPIVRVHLTAGTTSNTIGVIRAVPVEQQQGVTVSHFGFNATSTTEAVGVANGQLQAGGVRTLRIPAPGSTKAVLEVDAATGTSTLAVEGSNDGTNYTALTLQPVAGGAGVASISFTGSAALPQQALYEADLSNQRFVRAHCTAFTSGVILGSVKLVSLPTAQGLQNSQKPSYMVSSQGLAPTSSLNVAVVESGAAKVTTIKRVIIYPGTATAAGVATLTVNRNTVAATAAGTNPTGAQLQKDAADAAFSGLVRTGAFTVVGVTTTASQYVIPVPTPISTTANPAAPIVIDFTDGGTMKGLVVPVGATNGLMFTHSGLSGAAGFGLDLEWTEE